MKKGHKITVSELVQIAVFTAIIAAMAQISIPMPGGVPMTLQTLAVPLAGLVLGRKNGTISAVLYVLLALCGVPVLAGFSGGPGMVFGMTGGFILSFPFMAFFAGWGMVFFDRLKKSGKGGRARGYAVIAVFLVIGAVINYLAGTVWFSLVTGSSMAQAFLLCVAPFIPTSVLKIILDTWLGPLLRATLLRAHILEVRDAS